MQNKLRDKSEVQYHTALPVLFGVKKYADVLAPMCEARGIQVNKRSHLVELTHRKKQAVFENLDSKQRRTVHYDLLHIAPPMQAPEVLKTGARLTDAAGYVDVNKFTMQHSVYRNVFAAGDCSNVPTSKTAAAISGQVGVLEAHLTNAMLGKAPLSSPQYDGYTSCPVVTSNKTCVMAEFDFDGQPLESFPAFLRQSRQNPLMFAVKAHFMPHLYWHGLLKGRWNGPRFMRKLMHLGMSK